MVLYLLILTNHRGIGLMGGKYKNLGNLHMFRRTRGIVDHIGHIVARERLNATIQLCSTLIVATETYIGEMHDCKIKQDQNEGATNLREN